MPFTSTEHVVFLQEAGFYCSFLVETSVRNNRWRPRLSQDLFPSIIIIAVIMQGWAGVAFKGNRTDENACVCAFKWTLSWKIKQWCFVFFPWSLKSFLRYFIILYLYFCHFCKLHHTTGIFKIEDFCFVLKMRLFVSACARAQFNQIFSNNEPTAKMFQMKLEKKL